MLSFLSPLLDFLGADGHLNALCRQYIVIILSGGIFISLSNGLNPLIRNRGNTIGATAIMSSGLVTNIVFDYFLVYIEPCLLLPVLLTVKVHLEELTVYG